MSDWYQQHLTPPDVLELNIRIGVVPSADHVQVLVELKDPTNGILIGQWSRPHTTMTNLRTTIAWGAATAIEHLEASVEPF
jgi:hypothetical protein